MKKPILVTFATLATTLVLSACQQTPTTPKSPYTLAEEVLLKKIHDQFAQGNYRGVITTVNKAPETSVGTDAFKTEALKHKAFSECLTRQTTRCRNTFRKLLAQSPDFELSEAEINHPQWGPVYQREKARAERLQAANANKEGLERPSSMPKSELRVGPRQR